MSRGFFTFERKKVDFFIISSYSKDILYRLHWSYYETTKNTFDFFTSCHWSWNLSSVSKQKSFLLSIVARDTFSFLYCFFAGKRKDLSKYFLYLDCLFPTRWFVAIFLWSSFVSRPSLLFFTFYGFYLYFWYYDWNGTYSEIFWRAWSLARNLRLSRYRGLFYCLCLDCLYFFCFTYLQ